jgi:TonB family protein
MYKLFLLLLLTCLLNPVFAQTKIKYLDARYKEIEKRKAVYEMTETELNDSVYKTIRYKGHELISAIIVSPKNNPEYAFQTEFQSNGLKLNMGPFISERKQGIWYYYNKEGIIYCSKQYEQDIEKYYTSYFSNGQKRKEVGVRKGEYDGLCTYYDKLGNIILQGNYKKTIRVGDFQHFYPQGDSIIASIADTSSKDSFLTAEIMPEFPGGEGAMMKFIAYNLDYPKEAIERGIEGKIFIRFTVNKDGMIYDAMVMNTEILGYGCERASIEIIENMPDWSPGMSLGKPVKVYFNIPLRFKLY